MPTQLLLSSHFHKVLLLSSSVTHHDLILRIVSLSQETRCRSHILNSLFHTRLFNGGHAARTERRQCLCDGISFLEGSPPRRPVPEVSTGTGDGPVVPHAGSRNSPGLLSVSMTSLILSYTFGSTQRARHRKGSCRAMNVAQPGWPNTACLSGIPSQG